MSSIDRRIARGILAEVESFGGSVSYIADGCKISLFLPDGVELPDDLIERVWANKPEIVALLAPPKRPPGLPPGSLWFPPHRNPVPTTPAPKPGPPVVPVSQTMPADLTDVERERWQRATKDLTPAKALEREQRLAFGDIEAVGAWMRGWR